MNNSNQVDDGVMFAVAGTSRWGKSHWVKQRVKDAKRLIVRDPRGEYKAENCIQVKSIRELAGMLREVGHGAARISYFGSDADTPEWCILAYTWGQLWPAVIINEEVASITSSGKAPKAWGDLVRMGLYYGNHIYGVTQRPQECDKTLWGNATCIHVHGFVIPQDIEYVARIIGASVDDVKALQKYDWLERWQGEENLRRYKYPR